MSETTTVGVSRRALSIAAAAGLALTGTLTVASGVAQSAPTEHKVWVCKYVDIPGQNERLKDGKQPIEVDWHSLTGKDGPPAVGDTFSDRHEKSVVVQVGGEDPGRSACEPDEPTTPPTTEPTTPPTTEPTTPPTTETTPPTTTTKTSDKPGKPKPPSGGGEHVTPGVGAPDTGGSGGSSPASGIIGSSLLLAAAGILGRDLLLRRREATRD